MLDEMLLLPGMELSEAPASEPANLLNEDGVNPLLDEDGTTPLQNEGA